LLPGLRVDAGSPEQRLLLFLDKSTAMTAPSSHAIPTTISFNAEAGPHITTSHALNYPGPMPEYFEAVPSTALRIRSVKSPNQQMDLMTYVTIEHRWVCVSSLS
jgi:hypothetical protein